MKSVWIVCQHAGSPRHGMNYRPYHLARELTALGVDVTVISGSTSHEYYAPPVTNGRYTLEDVDGLRYVWIRTPGYGESRSLGRVKAWAAYLAGLYGIGRVGLPRPDAIIVSSPPPYPIVPAARLARRYGSKLVFEVRDLWPLSLVELGGASPRHPFVMLTQWVEDFAYRRSGLVVCVVAGALEYMRSRGLDPGKFLHIPNGVSVANMPPSATTTRRAFPDRRFIVGYAGKVGIAYGMEALLEAARLLKLRPDIGIAVCGAGKGARKLIYDAHEYSPGQHVDVGLGRSKNRYADAVLKTWLGKCDSMMTIGYGIADLYQSNYGIRPVVITNSPYYKTLSPKRTEDGRIRLVHHGLAARQRNLETMIEVLRLLDERFTLDFYLVSHDDTYYKELRNFAAQEKRVRFNEPVPMTELPECLNQYDIGIRFYPANTLNLQNGLPNKFFEFVQARLGVAVGPTPEAKRMVEKYGFGVVAKDFEPASMARALNALTSEDVMRFKSRADSCAYELSADENAKRLKAMIDGLQGTGDVA